MRRFSKRNPLVTLNEINVTPLLDIAFVLLLIFIITRPILENSLPLNLPEGGLPVTQITRSDILTVDVTPAGVYQLEGRAMPLDRIMNELAASFRANPDSVVYIRADKKSYWEHAVKVISECQNRNITRFSIQTIPAR